MSSFGNSIAEVALRRFSALPAKLKPRQRNNGTFEWVPMSAIVLSQGSHSSSTTLQANHPPLDTSPKSLEQNNGSLTCVSIATGCKSLPHSKIPLAHGIVLHDSHAEVLVLRAFNHFLLSECHSLLTSPCTGHSSTSILRRRSQDEISNHPETRQPFTIREDIRIHMYCSEAPCGDASMELVMAAQEDATPWPVPQSPTSLPGRANFSSIGVVRRKPARPDAPISLSKSCTDKLSLKECISILSSPTALFISPENAYISTLTVPTSQSNPTGFSRAFGDKGRMAQVSGHSWKGGYAFRPFIILDTDHEFEFSRRNADGNETKLTPSNISAISTPSISESLINGTRQGRKQFDPRGASATSKAQLWRLCMQVLDMLLSSDNDIVVSDWKSELEKARKSTYAEFKDCGVFANREKVKECVRDEALKGWVKNGGDEFGFTEN
ncbi:MAG: hypothetical protein M1834_000974 [Cirrosporium novae-zelandiae]|nr:MAG: hypothetical protein M1834_000974 [Cirrosporium novae-zelandiae]